MPMRPLHWILLGLAAVACAQRGDQPAPSPVAASGGTTTSPSATPAPVPPIALATEAAPGPHPHRVLAEGSRGMVSSAHPEATAAGLAILQAGGNAFDAAVAVAATLNVVEPMNSGIGGYGTTLVYDAAQGQAHFLNSSGRIPRAVDANAFRAPTPGYEANRSGAKAVSTPGNARAWQALHDRFGSKPWADLFVDAIRAAEDGFPLSVHDAGMLAYSFEAFPPEARTIYGRDGKPLPEGAVLVQRDLGGTLRRMAREGAGVVHGGEIGQKIADVMAANGGFLTLADLEANEPEWREPITIDYRGRQVMTASPPATAFPSLIRLGLLSQFDLRALGHNSAAYLHLFAEVSKHAFWCRLRYAGDPDVSPPPLGRLLSPTYWREQAAGLDRNRASRFVPPGAEAKQGEHTTHFVVADAAGNVVSATQTLGNLYGSRILVPGTGIWLNNSLEYCTFEPPGNPMDAHAGRRKLSGDCPTFVFHEGRLWAALGTPGGHTIGQTVPQVVVNLIDFDMDIQAAITAPRIAFAEPDGLLVEDLVDPAVRADLTHRGHNLVLRRRIGNVHGLILHYGPDGKPIRFQGGADPRIDGVARGW
jgi:gamma-glutamyltranspeptidase/glutathione hydrolase